MCIFEICTFLRSSFIKFLNIESIIEDDHDIPAYTCEICVEPKPLKNSFDMKGCSHFYCIQYTVMYIKSKLDCNMIHIACPMTDCGGVLDPDFCREILPTKLFNRWGAALCESAILEPEKVYCPYEYCSALLINDGKKRVKSECPICGRGFCLQCKVGWHEGLDCKKFQEKQLELDAKFIDLANLKGWRQCPDCKFYVEKTDGCRNIPCKCRITFCNKCGEKSNSDHRC